MHNAKSEKCEKTFALNVDIFIVVAIHKDYLTAHIINVYNKNLYMPI